MDPKQRPHSRGKKVGSGSADVSHGGKVGSSPVGHGGQGGSGKGNGDRAGLSDIAGLVGSAGGASLLSSLLGGGSNKGGKKINLKTILIIALVVIVLFFVLRSCGTFGPSDPGDISDPGDYSDIGGYEDDPNTPLDRSVSPLAREKYVTPVGNGNDTFTIMVYMCGTDLESKYGMATSDLQEMMKATISSNVNIIVETGGCSKWKTPQISNSCNQIYKVNSGSLSLLKDNAGTASMTDPTNLTNFINFCTTNFTADRYALIFWDHGGGSVSGYGYDEKHSGSSSMTLDKIDSALKKVTCKFDFIGFDACLMATLENAIVCEKYADYLLASEETEPGTGWYYTRWITELSKNTSKPTLDIAKTIVDDFISSSRSASADAKVTLSLIDLAELHGTVPDTFSEFASTTTTLIKSDDYKKVSDARAGVRQFAQSSQINQVDLIDLANRIGTSASSSLAKALKGCVKYNRTSISRSYGVSIYFPYENTRTVNSAVASYNALGIDSDYTNCIKSFASLELGGQIAGAATQTSSTSGDFLSGILSSFAGGGSSTSPLSLLTGAFGSGSSASSGFPVDPSTILSLLGGISGKSMPAGMEWVDTDLIADKAEDIAQNYLDASHIKATEKNGKQVLSLEDNEWALIQTVELNVFAADGDAFIDLGYDNVFEFDDDGDLLLDFDGTWLTLNGQVCAYYLVSDIEQDNGTYITTGRIPAKLNGTQVDLQVVFEDGKDPVITGAYPVYDEAVTDVQAKGMIEVKPGDTIQLLCDCYKADNTYDATYTLGKSFTVPESGLSVINLKVNADSFKVTYRLTDIYGNHFWTPVFEK